MPEADLHEDMRRDFALAEAAAREAGALAHGYFFARARSWTKDDDSPVSDADHAVDRLLHQRLLAHRPEYGWISEERADNCERLGRERVWIVDPIDGTRAFLRARPHWVVSIGLSVGGVPRIGVLFNPLTGEMFSAIKGFGAYLNGAPLAAAAREAIAGCRLMANRNRIHSERWKTPWPEVELSRVNSFAYQIAKVASGEVDAAIAFDRIHQWDLAAASVILTEAGGVMSTPDGAPFEYNAAHLRFPGAVAAAAGLHPALVDFISRNRQDEA